MSRLIEELRNSEELRKLFKKKRWVRVCRECGEFLGNTANWIVHIKTVSHGRESVMEMDMEPGVWIDTLNMVMDMKPPAVNPEHTEMEELTEDRNLRKRNWTTEDKKFKNRNWSMEVDPDEETVFSEEEAHSLFESVLPQYRSWSMSSYQRRASGYSRFPQYRSWSTSSYHMRASH